MPHALHPCYFNPLPSYEERQRRTFPFEQAVDISIHSPHTRGDQAREAKNIWRLYFNPLPSHEGRQCRNRENRSRRRFQSTPLTRGETLSVTDFFATVRFQSTPLTRGETTANEVSARRHANFNPLPSYEGRLSVVHVPLVDDLFQSTPLIRGETSERHTPRQMGRFQSTPLMRGETKVARANRQRKTDFNPLPSCEGRLTYT